MRSLLWRWFLPNARIRVRIVAAVVLAMTVVLLGAGAFVFWRVSYALDRQLNQDLLAYSDLVTTGSPRVTRCRRTSPARWRRPTRPTAGCSPRATRGYADC